jgi:hypothetical protein
MDKKKLATPVLKEIKQGVALKKVCVYASSASMNGVSFDISLNVTGHR